MPEMVTAPDPKAKRYLHRKSFNFFKFCKDGAVVQFENFSPAP
jgi:hypothetical protein